MKVFYFLATLGTSIAALQQPTCDDAGPQAGALFIAHDRARACLAALNKFQNEVTLSQSQYETFVQAMGTYEPVQNRLCRWQRLVKEPPDTREAHEVAWQPVKRAYDDLAEADRRVWGAYGMMRRACVEQGAVRMGEVVGREL